MVLFRDGIYDSITCYTAYSYFAATYWPNLPNIGSCAGTESAALFGCGLLTTYLFLFINFYIQTYKKPVRGKKPVTNGNANGHRFVRRCCVLFHD